MINELNELLYSNNWDLIITPKNEILFRLVTKNKTILWVKQIKGLFSTYYKSCEELKVALTKVELQLFLDWFKRNAKYFAQKSLMNEKQQTVFINFYEPRKTHNYYVGPE